MNESRYLQLFSDASDALLRLIGLDQAYLARGFSWFTVETHIMHKGEAHAGELVAVDDPGAGGGREADAHLPDRDPRGGRRGGRDRRADAAACRHQGGPRLPGGAGDAGRLLRIAAAQAGLPRPADAGRHVGAKRA